MDVEEIDSRIEAIKAYAKRREWDATHSMEDSLFEELVQSIAEGPCPNPQECCQEALKVLELGFNRWYA